MNTADKPNNREADAAWDARMTAEDPRFPARKAASLALDKYVREWIDGYELDDGEVNHAPTELESFLIYDAFAGLSEDEEYLQLRAAWKSLCGVAVHPAEMMDTEVQTAHLMAPVGSDLQAADAQGEGPCCDDDGCPTELAVLQRFWRGQPVPPEREPLWFKAIPKINQPSQE